MNAMTRDEFHSNYWNYYLMLEKEVLEALEYVELLTDNFSTYSNKFAALIRSIGSELDVFFKVYWDIPADATKNIKIKRNSHYYGGKAMTMLSIGFFEIL